MSAARGRPRLAEGEGRTVVFTLRLTDLEHIDLEIAARLSGQPVTRWARDVLLSEARFAKHITDVRTSDRRPTKAKRR